MDDTKLRELEQHRIKQLERLDGMIAHHRRKLLLPRSHWLKEREALLRDLAFVRALLAKEMQT